MREPENELFEPGGFRRSLKEIHDALYDVPLGGPLDTLSLLCIGAATLCATPYVFNVLVTKLDGWPWMPNAIANAVPMLAATALAGIGAAWLAHVFTVPLRERSYLRSSLHFKSSPPPMIPGSKPGMYFGLTVDKGEPIYVDDDTLTRHGLIIGQSGVGKTVAGSLLMLQQIERGGGLLFIDPKEDLDNLQSIYNYAVWAGRQDDLMILCPGMPHISNSYNPILFGDADEVASRILGLIPSTEGNSGADFYKQAANSAIRAIVSAFQYLKVPYTMADLSLLLDNVNALEKLYNMVLSKGETTQAAIELRLWVENFRRAYDPKAQAGVGSLNMVELKKMLGGIISRLQQFGTGTFGEITSTYDPEVKLHELVEQGKLLYVALPTMSKDIAAVNFAKLMIADVRNVVGLIQRGQLQKPKIPFYVFIDEAGRMLGSGEAITVLTEQARAARVFFHLAVQNLAQFKVVADELAELVPGNTVIKMIFRLGSNDSPNELAELIGMRTRITRSVSQTAAKSTSAEFTKVGPGHTESSAVNTAYGEREQEDFIIHPDAIKRLDKGECIMLYEGGSIFDLRIPMVRITAAMAKSIGPYRVQHAVPSSKKGLFDLAKDIDSFTSRAPLAVKVGAGQSSGEQAAAAETRKAARVARTSADQHDPSPPAIEYVIEQDAVM